MKKKIFGIKIGTIIQFVLCLIFAFAIWLSVRYSALFSDDNNDTTEIDEQSAFALSTDSDFEV